MLHALPSAGFVLWLTGLPASGKSTLAHELYRQLEAHSIHTVIMDSDELRHILTPQPTYTEEERAWFYSVIVALATWLSKSGVNVLIAATANRRAYREQARRQIARFAEVYVECDLAICQKRDPKGIYAQAAAGNAPDVPGVGGAYEPPIAAEAVVNTNQMSPNQAAIALLGQLSTFLL